jgi:hypothetical protein
MPLVMRLRRSASVCSGVSSITFEKPVAASYSSHMSKFARMSIASR